ncbi:hypothetical protein EWM64_g798 [Hericium alpestre]|uniref:Small ribosomal subunit protein uS10m n=1 Tax=Hericium alpestre TaxID=135208 RepID=A0A4Z0AC51_9AGAM|nr:hypothetical protein EWM64_g798 [Hericium alpestre]
MTNTNVPASESQSIHSNVIPSEVGWQFVPQYYTFVNKHPNRLHCFYTKSSTFIHGNEGDDGKPCFGQQEIHNKITSIGFEDCKVFIHSVDAQSSANGGIIIQVIGEMSNRGEPWRKFVQTFFLAEQPNGLKPFQHPQTHGIPVALVHFRSFYPPLLPIFTNFALHAAASLGIPVSGVASLPTQRSLWTVPRGPFVHKKSQENFERKVHKRAVKAFDADAEVVDRWIKYLERHALAGVGIRVVRWHRVPVGVGRKQLESAVSRMRLEGPTDKEKVKALGQQIITEETKAAQGTTA